MKINAVIVGVNEWVRYTLPAVESILKVDPALNIILVDYASDPPYFHKGANIVRRDERISYADALNVGIHHDPADWYVLLNNDILLKKPIAWRFDDLDPMQFYGFKLWDHISAFPEICYLSGWCMLLSKEMHQAIGDFDANCAPMFFEDADYSYRVTKAGYNLIELDREDWGVYHIEEHRHRERKTYMQQHAEERRRNREYVKGKHGL